MFSKARRLNSNPIAQAAVKANVGRAKIMPTTRNMLAHDSALRATTHNR